LKKLSCNMAARFTMAPGDKQFDVSPKEIENIKKRAQLREIAKREYLKQVTNPYRHGTGEGGYLFDPQIQRFMSMKVTSYDYFKPGFRSFTKWFGVFIVPVLAYAYIMQRSRNEFEGKCRRGEISYRERRFKFS